MEAISYIEVAQIRGDISAGDSYRQALEMDYGITPSGDELVQVLERAEEIYKNLESQRVALGLGKFDNSIPPIAEAYYRYQGFIK